MKKVIVSASTATITAGKVSIGNKKDAADILLYGSNDSKLYKTKTKSIIENLAKKLAKGTYDKEKACKLWKYLADDVAISYSKDFETKPTAETRRMAAKLFEKYYKNEVKELAQEIKKAQKAKGKKKK